MGLETLVEKNPKIYDLAIELEKKLPALRDKAMCKFFNQVSKKLQEKLSTGWIVKNSGSDLSNRCVCLINIYKEAWKPDFLQFHSSIENEQQFWGISSEERDVLEKGKKNKSSFEIGELARSSKNWFHWEWIELLESHNNDICHFIFNEKDAVNQYVDSLFEFIKKFEPLLSKLYKEMHSKEEV